MTRILALAFVASCLLAAPAVADPAWERMVVRDVFSPAPPPLQVLKAWADRIPAVGRSAAIQFAVLPYGDRVAVVSVLSDPSLCHPLQAGAFQELCPARVTVLGGPEPQTAEIPDACFFRVDEVWTPGLDPVSNGVWAGLDPGGAGFHLVAAQAGSPVPACTKDLQ